jgi:hypothetical protein
MAAVFAGDRRVWRWATLASLPALVLTLVYCVKPRPYYTGTNSVEAYSYVAPAAAGAPLCVSGLRLPARTAGIRLQLIAPGNLRPRLDAVIYEGATRFAVSLPPADIAPGAASLPTLAIPETLRAVTPASLCVTASGPVNWAGTPLLAPGTGAPTVGGAPQAARVALWYLPRTGAKRSYLSRAGDIFRRAALFRPGIVGVWTYPLLLFVVLPLLAMLAVRTLALAAAGRAHRLGAWLFTIAALNACCWALITPAFQAPDEVDHFAYTQSLVERGEGPSRDPLSPQLRWSSAESLALEDMSFFTDHQVGDTKMPWARAQQQAYEAQASRLRPSLSNGGGYTTSAVHGPIYYLALAPAYAVTSGSSVFAQLTLMRISSALLGALVVLFTYLLVRELAPRRPWLAALAALLVAFEPMYGFISGIVNNDVGVNAAAAALELMLIRILRRGITIPLGLLTGAVLLALPTIKGTGLALYPVAALVFAVSLWRHHDRRDLLAWGALALSALATAAISAHVLSIVEPAAATHAGVSGPSIGSNSEAVSAALHHLSSFAVYLWEVFLPRLGFMAPHFPSNVYPGFVIFIERGWGAFGWYDVFFPSWVYWVIFVSILASFLLAGWAARLEWRWVRANAVTVAALVLMPVSVIVAFEAAYYTSGVRPVLAEFGRYAFPAIGPMAALAVGSLHAFGRKRMLVVGVVLLVAVLSLGYAGQLVTLTGFYA